MITGSIVLYHSAKDMVERVIHSFDINKNRRLFIIDNSEKRTDVYLDRENIEYIYTGKNLGYGKGHNIGIQKAIDYKAKYHVVLNPDIFFETAVIDKLVEYADRDKEIFYMLPKVINLDGEQQYLCKLLPTPFDLIVRRFLPKTELMKRIEDRYVLKGSGYQTIMNPPCLSGCFMFMRVSALRQYNLRFDERFFMYCEDFDLIRRIHRVGKTIYYPEVSIVHMHAHESYKSWKMLRIHIISAWKYFNKYGWILDKERKQMNKSILQEINEGLK